MVLIPCNTGKPSCFINIEAYVFCKITLCYITSPFKSKQTVSQPTTIYRIAFSVCFRRIFKHMGMILIISTDLIQLFDEKRPSKYRHINEHMLSSEVMGNYHELLRGGCNCASLSLSLSLSVVLYRRPDSENRSLLLSSSP